MASSTPGYLKPGLWSRLSYSFTASLLAASSAGKTPGENAALHLVPPELDATELADTFLAAGQMHVDSGKPGSPWTSATARVLLRLHWPLLLWHGALTGLELARKVIAAVLLLHLIRWLNDYSKGEPVPVASGWLWAGLLAFSLGIRLFLGNESFWAGRRLANTMVPQLVIAMYRKVLRLPASTLDSDSSSKALNLMTADARRFEYAIHMWPYLWAGPLLTVAVLVLISLQLDIFSAVAGLSVYCLVIPISSALAKAVANARRVAIQHTDTRLRLVGEAADGALAVKMLGREDYVKGRVEAARAAEARALRRTNLVRGMQMVLESCMMPLASLVTFLVYGARSGSLDLATVYYVLALLALPKWGLCSMFYQAVNVFGEMGVIMGRVDAFLQLPEAEQAGPTQQQPSFASDVAGGKAVPAGTVALTGGTYRWPQPATDAASSGAAAKDGAGKGPAQAAALSGVCFSAAPGQLVGVWGPSGAGKSSLLAALLGELKPAALEPCSDGDASQGGAQAHRLLVGSVAYYAQEPWIIAGTLRDNILFGRPYDEVWYGRVLAACCLEDDAARLVGGDLAQLGERGANLSGGQRARVALARACYGRPEVALLDDPLSAVDPRVCRDIFDRVLGPRGLLAELGATRILVTHQSRLLRKCDRVLVLSGGCARAWGTWAEAAAAVAVLQPGAGADGSDCGEDQGNIESAALDHEVLTSLEDSLHDPVESPDAVCKLGVVLGPLSTEGTALAELSRSLDSRSSVPQMEGAAAASEEELPPVPSPPPLPDTPPLPATPPPRRGTWSGVPEVRLSLAPEAASLELTKVVRQPAHVASSQSGRLCGGRRMRITVAVPGSALDEPAPTAKAAVSGHLAVAITTSSGRESRGIPKSSSAGSLQRLALAQGWSAKLAFSRFRQPVDTSKVQAHHESDIEAPDSSAATSPAAAGSPVFALSRARTRAPSRGSSSARFPSSNTFRVFRRGTFGRAESVVSDTGRSTHGGPVAEERATGGVPWSVYGTYCRTLGVPLLVAVGLLMVCFHGTSLVMSWWLGQWARADGADQHDSRWMLVYGLVTGAIMLMAGAACALFFVAATSAATTIHNRMLASVIRAPLSFFHANPTGRIVTRFSKDQVRVDDQLPLSFFDTCQVVVQVLATLVMVAIALPVILAMVPPLAIGVYVIRARYIVGAVDVERLEAVTWSPVAAEVSNAIQGLTTIHAYRAHGLFAAKLDDLMRRNVSWYFCRVVHRSWLGFRLDALSTAVAVAAVLLSVAMRSGVNTAVLALALTNVIGVVELLQWLTRQTCEMVSLMASLQRILEYGALEPEAEADCDGAEAGATDGRVAEGKATEAALAAVPEGWPRTGELCYEDVTAEYRPDLPPCLVGLSFRLEAGSSCGVVGRTGSGKSSLMLTLFRLIRVTHGTIRLDGVDVAAVPRAALRRHLAVIPQDPVLFSGTLRSNLDPCSSLPDSRLWEVLGAVQLRGPVAALPGGLDAGIAHGGGNLSVGQRQLFSLARALLQDAKVLALDEATANVDHATDELIQRAVDGYVRDGCGRVLVMIAHRIDTVMAADRLLVLAGGELAESGPPAELAAAGGVFSRMVEATQRRDGGERGR